MKNHFFSCTAILALMLLLSACQETPTTSPSDVISYPQVHLDSPYLHGRVKVVRIATERVGQNQLKANITIQNLTPTLITVDYQYQFLKDATVYENSQPGITTTIAPFTSVTITLISKSDQVTTFDISLSHRR